MRIIPLLTFSIIAFICCGPNAFESDPSKARFISTDISNFWNAFDQLSDEKNPFKPYLDHGTPGLKDFIPYRIESAKKL